MFTDWSALERDSHIMESGEQPEARLARLGELLQIVRKFGQDTGIVINPFGPSTFSMERALLENIAQMPGFKNTFGDLGGVNLEDYADEEEKETATATPPDFSSSSSPSISSSSPTPSQSDLSPDELARQQDEKERKLWELLTSDD